MGPKKQFVRPSGFAHKPSYIKAIFVSKTLVNLQVLELAPILLF